MKQLPYALGQTAIPSAFSEGEDGVLFGALRSALAALIKTDTKYDATTKKAGVLQGDSSIVGVQNQLRSLLGSSSGASGTSPPISRA